VNLLYSIGYEKALLSDMIATLADAGVKVLLDVRDRPISRRPGFSKRQLAAAIEEAGMGYVISLRSARRPRDGSPTSGANGSGSGRSWMTGSPAPRPNSIYSAPPISPRASRAACCATRRIGGSVTAAASPGFSPAVAALCSAISPFARAIRRCDKGSRSARRFPSRRRGRSLPRNQHYRRAGSVSL
jgi:hypothetical protein